MVTVLCTVTIIQSIHKEGATMEGQYCLYLRKSRADHDAEKHGEGETLARHEQILKALANKMEIEVSAIYKEIVSGESISARPEMIKLLQEVENGKWDGVIVMEIERLARGATIDQGIVAQAFQLSGTRIITPTKVYDPANEFDEEYFEFGLFMSRREYKTINRRIQRGRKAAANEGRYIASTAPLGYKRIKLQNDKGWSLEVIPEQADIIRLIFDLYVNGEKNPDGSINKTGSTKICRLLDNRNIKPISGGKWSPASIRDILHNPVYIGKIRWGYDKYEKASQNGSVIIKRQRSDDCIIAQGLHEAIIDEETFNKAQKLLKSHSKVSIQSGKKLQNPLTGLVYCKKCGSLMTRLAPTSKTPYAALKCPNRYCNNISAPIYLIEKKIISSLKMWLYNYELNIQRNEIKHISPTYNNSYDALEKERAMLKSQLDKTFDLLERGIYDDETFLERNKTIKAKIEECNKSMNKLQELKNSEEKALSIENNFIPAIKNIVEGYDTIKDASMKNELLKAVIKKIEYIKETRNTRGKRDIDNFSLDLYPIMPYK